MSKEKPSVLSGIKIPLKNVTLQTSINVPGGMPDLTTINKEKAPNVKAFMMPQGLLLECKPVDKLRKDTISAIIPFANVKVMIFDDEEKEAA